MKVLLFVGILAIVHASAQYDRILQRLRNTPGPEGGDQKDNDANPSDGNKVLENKITDLKEEVKGISNIILMIRTVLDDAYQSDSSEQDQNLGGGHENTETSGSNGDDQTRGLSVLLRKMKSLMDETKQEQSGGQMHSQDLNMAKTMRKMQEP
ncbi:hypothetical protein ACJMK2_003825 [Sinanodonta woodiana]|uniref:Uncharacterized protein n=1 Tax=Sinanodonta woodiana TaxID=1069815 RepID=A0ABD3XZB8_SINWO